MAPFVRPAAVLMSTIALLTGCAAPPQGVGETSQILAGADQPGADFAIVPVTRATLPMIESWPDQPSSLKTSGWLPPGRGVKQEFVAPGDKVDVTIWSNEENGLLTVGGQKNTALPGPKVSQDGTVFLPYAGSVHIANMTVDEARQAIQEKLTAVVPSAQVVLTHSAGRENAVQVVAGLPQAGNVGMPDHAFTMLDLISNAGGIPATVVNPQIQVQRDGKLYGIAFADLVQHPEKDAVLKPGDRIIVTPETRYFRSFGAAGHETRVVFPMPNVTALDAVSIIGGLNENEADAKSVLVLRTYPASAVRKDGKGPTQERTIFAIDLTTADGMFSAGEFTIEDKDTIVVAQSPLVTQNAIIAYVQKLLALPINVMNVPLTARKF
jgi:polysaccharide export outer membrane protein